ncbi:uncharacterized protein LOC127880631 isoform X2 [Dreissena polymorpha]|uniref:uncharacterized protein LOC127880631 isoform X2 n=1 Tax=Dreissena polymorpha TaxID=45954 RepID=UPI002263E1FE|nr:uncharacterized protein LOC127880631 isoform X2 [Dreissena polymorpha]
MTGRELDVVEALKNVRHVKDTLQNMRDSVYNFHGCLYEEAVAVANAVGVDPSIPRRCGRQTQRNNIPTDTPETYYKRVLTIPFHSWTTTCSSLVSVSRRFMRGLLLHSSLFHQ